MSKYEVTALGELNIDLILNDVAGFPEIGKEKFAGQMTLTLGSSTAIFAANISSLGVRTAFSGMIGRDSFGALVKNSLEARGVSTEFLVENGNVATGATIVMNFGEDRANLTYQGAMDVMTSDDINPAVFTESGHIHISSVFMQSGLMRDMGKILSAASGAGITVSMDTQWDPSEKWDFDLASILPGVDVFMPNETELKAITRTSCTDDAISAVVPYLKRMAIVKCGSRGSILVRKDGTRNEMPAYLNRNVVDAIGAGDSFNSGFISGFVKGLPDIECQRLGNLAGAINTTAAGGTGAFASRGKILATAEALAGREAASAFRL